MQTIMKMEQNAEAQKKSWLKIQSLKATIVFWTGQEQIFKKQE